MSGTDEAFGDESESTRSYKPQKLEFSTLGVGDYLYQEAGPRPFVYRVEKGVIVIFERQIGRPVKIIGVAGKGDYFGLGCLEHHRDNARAVVETVVSYVPKTEFAGLADRDPILKRKQDTAIARDFEHGKLLARDRGRSTPIECVAAFLVALSRQNAQEGRDPLVVSGSCECVRVTSLLLDMESVAFETALLRLRWLGLIEPCGKGLLRLKDIPALEGVADGVVPPVKAPCDDIRAAANGASPRPHSPRIFMALLGGPSALAAVCWRAELRETIWLVSVIGGLSVIAVGSALIVAAFQ